ncbi:MAG: beta-glucosidase [Bradymonadia bacterium]|jgi:beta-glucosidase
MSIHFPKDFVWGVATSSYQIEGAAQTDGRGESIWDRFCSTPGKIADGTDGDVACDHYNRWADDLDLMKRLNMQAYRFSIAWPRILPAGSGRIEPRGLDFYERLVDGMLARGITPWATLYHWDLPQALQEKGGWTNRDTAKAFAEYTDVVSRRLGDRVKNWITHNEPWCASVLGHLNGEHAPGLKDPQAHLSSSHHILLSHGMAVPIIRENAKDAQVGITLNLVHPEPASQSDADRAATTHFDAWFNRWYLDPIAGRGYPADLRGAYLKEDYIDDWSFVRPGDMKTIAAPTDFLGINFYNRGIIRSDKIPEEKNAPRTLKPVDNFTDMGWEVHPDSLRLLLERVERDYDFPALYITENGAAYATGPDARGRVADVKRQAYLDGHIRACHAAVETGVPLKGYFAWSFMDNFEWAFGYEKRFGLVHVDYDTQVRTAKDSALWYAKLIEEGGL